MFKFDALEVPQNEKTKYLRFDQKLSPIGTKIENEAKKAVAAITLILDICAADTQVPGIFLEHRHLLNLGHYCNKV